MTEKKSESEKKEDKEDKKEDKEEKTDSRKAQKVILYKKSECYSRFTKETCNLYFFPGISVREIYSEQLVEKVDKKLRD